MNVRLLRCRGLALFVAALLVFAGVARADPPSRVARLGSYSGAISLSPAGEDDWVRATSNRPLTRGDRLWSEAGARAEIQIGGAMVRVNESTGVSVLNLDDRIAQLRLTQGTLSVNVRRLAPGEVFEVDTPNLALTLSEPGAYRIEVDPDGDTTTIVMRRGLGEVYGENASYAIDPRQPHRFTGTDLREYGRLATPRLDDFDRWAAARDRAYDNSPSARYVSRDVVGFQDLDANGSWRVDASYGNVWTPYRVPVGWAPYRDGHWAWIDPWGWTWVDDAPWGFAVSHYGRWANFGGRWGWIPGPVSTRAYYAPALVVFVGGANFQFSISSGNVGGVGWFPLAPREVYRPAYVVSRGYFENLNRSNTVVNNTVINNIYNQTNITNIVYANQRVPGAVVAVPTNTFVQSQPVSRAAVRVDANRVARATVVAVPQLAPTERSLRGATGAGERPPQRVFERPVIARSAPPAAPAGFRAQQSQLEADPGRPLDDAARKVVKPAAAAPVPAIKLVAPAQAAPPTERPPAPATAGRGNERQAQPEGREAPAAAAAPPLRAEPAPRPQANPPGREAQAVEPRSPSEPRGGTEPRGQGAAAAQRAEPRGNPAPRPDAETRGQAGAVPSSASPPAAPPQRPPEATVTSPRATPQAPAAQRTEPRGKPEPRAADEPRGPSGAAPAPTPPPAPPQRTPEPTLASPRATPPAPAAEPRGKPNQRENAEARGPGTTAPPRSAEPKAAPPASRPPTAQGRPEAAPPSAPAPAARAAPQQPPAAAAAAPPKARPPAAPPEPDGQNAKGGGKSGENKKRDESS